MSKRKKQQTLTVGELRAGTAALMATSAVVAEIDGKYFTVSGSYYVGDPKGVEPAVPTEQMLVVKVGGKIA